VLDFFIFGGLKLKRKGERKASAYIGNTANRKMVKEFYEKKQNMMTEKTDYYIVAP